MKKTDILISNSTGMTVIEKMDFDYIDNVCDALHFAFYPDGINDNDNDNEDLDIRMLSLWHIFLSLVGWTEDEFWKEYNSRPRHCPNCGEVHHPNNDIDEDKSDSKIKLN